jgi:hypothetical protein
MSPVLGRGTWAARLKEARTPRACGAGSAICALEQCRRVDAQIFSDPTVVAEHAFTTGLIPPETFERAAIPTQIHPGVSCDAAALPAAKRNATQLLDDGEHELATCYAVKGLGLVFIAEALRVMPDKIIRPYVSNCLTFGPA